MIKIYVGNLPFSTLEADLRGLFEQYGTVQTVSIVMDRMTGRPRGFAFVEMPNDDEARNAISKTNGFMADGRPLVVNEARPGPGPGGGGAEGGWRPSPGARPSASGPSGPASSPAPRPAPDRGFSAPRSSPSWDAPPPPMPDPDSAGGRGREKKKDRRHEDDDDRWN